VFWNEWHKLLESLEPDDEQWEHAEEFARKLQGLLDNRKSRIIDLLEAVSFRHRRVGSTAVAKSVGGPN
jgi:hypothetical protein